MQQSIKVDKTHKDVGLSFYALVRARIVKLIAHVIQIRFRNHSYNHLLGHYSHLKITLKFSL